MSLTGWRWMPKACFWVTDRENQRIQRFSIRTGNSSRETGASYAGLPAALDIGKQYIYMVNGFTGQVLRLDLDGKVLAVTGKAGNGVGEFGEAHCIAVSPKGEVYVADSVNRAVQKFVKKIAVGQAARPESAKLHEKWGPNVGRVGNRLSTRPTTDTAFIYPVGSCSITGSTYNPHRKKICSAAPLRGDTRPAPDLSPRERKPGPGGWIAASGNWSASLPFCGSESRVR